MSQKKITDDIPHLKDAGFGLKLCIFTEIARHPEGMTASELAEALECSKPAVWNHLRNLLQHTLIQGRRVSHNGTKAKVFKVTPFGIDWVQKEMRVVCELYSTIREEMVKK
jgi:predicted ArsR family transcriptional regulator